MELLKGYSVKGAELIKESYSIEGDNIFINAGKDTYKEVMRKLAMKLPEPVFFILEIPCDQEKEDELRIDEPNSLHKEVCYIDNLSHETIDVFFDSFGEILVNDGLSIFGVSSHAEQIEVIKDKYNCLQVYAKNKDPFIRILEEEKIPFVEHIVLASDLIAKENPGVCEGYKDTEGRSVFDIVKFLKEKCGMYVDHIEEVD